MKCPRCGGDMSGGVCDNCGFPVTRKIGYPTSQRGRYWMKDTPSGRKEHK